MTALRKKKAADGVVIDAFRILKAGGDVAVIVARVADAAEILDGLEILGAEIEGGRARLEARKGARRGTLRVVPASKVAPAAMWHYSGEILVSPKLTSRHDLGLWLRLSDICGARQRVRMAYRSGRSPNNMDLAKLKERLQ